MGTKNFGLIGAAGYIAPRHMQAIKETGNQLVAAVDPNDSVGILDRHFPEAKFFIEIERFDRHIEKLRRGKEADRVHYMSICSPNYVHDAHCRFALRLGTHAICEKPLVVNPWNLEALRELEQESGRRVYTVLQLRLLPTLQALRQRLTAESPSGGPARRKRAEVSLTYVTRRGSWYQTSWKGQEQKSGGIAVNIGIHLFDLLSWLFGSVQEAQLYLATPTRTGGRLELEWATVNWFLSVDKGDLPPGYLENGKPAFRSLTVDGHEIEFSEGFGDLHTLVYRDILSGGGFGLDDAKPAIELVHRVRQCTVVPAPPGSHPLLHRI